MANSNHQLQESTPHPAVDAAASDHPPPPPPSRWHHEDSSVAPPIRLMCSFGGRILPRPHDNQLRYVGGDTRIVALHRNSTFSALLSKLSKFTSTSDITVKYQLPNEDLDSLISITADEDLDNMFDEYDRLLLSSSHYSNPPPSTRTPRLRLFLFPSDGSGGAFGSILSGTGASKHDHWFFDALNGATLERGRSEASSIISEVPDYLFGLDNNSDEPATKFKSPRVSFSDPGSPTRALSSPHYRSTSSVHSVSTVQDAPTGAAAGEIKPEPAPVSQQAGYVQSPVWQYMPEPVQVYYMPGPVQGGSLPIRSVSVPMQYVPQVQQVGYRPVYVGGQAAVGRQGYEYPLGPTGMGMERYDVLQQQQQQPGPGILMRSNPALTVPMFRPTVAEVSSGAGELPAVTGSDMRIGRASQ